MRAGAGAPSEEKRSIGFLMLEGNREQQTLFV